MGGIELEWARGIVAQYGYLAVFVSTLLEGEAMVLVAAALVSAGMMHAGGVVLAAAAGAFAGHLAFFAIGRRWGMRLIRAFPSLHRHYPRANFVMDRHAAWSVFIFQYLYGMRLISALLFGCSTLSWPRFMFLQILNCLSWAALVFAIGSGLSWLGARLYAAAGAPGLLAGLALLALAGAWLWRRFGRRLLTAIWRDWREPGAEALDAAAGRKAWGAWRKAAATGAGVLLLALPEGEAGEALAAMIAREVRHVDRPFRLAPRWLAIGVQDADDLAGMARRFRDLPGLAGLHAIRLGDAAGEAMLRAALEEAACEVSVRRIECKAEQMPERTGVREEAGDRRGGAAQGRAQGGAQAGGMEMAALPDA